MTMSKFNMQSYCWTTRHFNQIYTYPVDPVCYVAVQMPLCSHLGKHLLIDIFL